MNHLDLFSGIGGFSLAARWTWGKDHNVTAFVEQDKYCQKVLNKHWPGVPIIDDIRNYTHDQTQTVDLLTGGFPCQPFSVAGKRRGKADDRYLWPEMFRVIQEAKPTWIIGENVPGIINMGLETTVVDLEAEGYEVELLVLGAVAVQAFHQRQRVWIVAHSKYTRQYEAEEAEKNSGVQQKSPTREKLSVNESEGTSCLRSEEIGRNTNRNDTNNDKQHGNNGRSGAGKASQFEEAGICKGEQWLVEPDMGRVANGVPNRVDRLKGLGNAIVPQVAYEIMQCIKEIGSVLIWNK